MSSDKNRARPTDQALVASPPSPRAVLAKGFNPSRMTPAWLVQLLVDWGNVPSTVFRERYPLFTKVRLMIVDRWPGEEPNESTMDCVGLFAEAIAMEARQGRDAQRLDAKHDSAAIAQSSAPLPPSSGAPNGQ